jgi:RiboL-PSP-HEPN
MYKAFEQFKNNIKSIRELEALHYHLVTELRLPNDLSDILRSQLVYAVSAFDKLIHELVRIGMIQSFLGLRTKTLKFNSFSISLETYNKIQQVSKLAEITEQNPEYFFEQEIISKHKHLSFQDPEKIADALSLIWEEKQKWQKIAISLNASDDYIKKRLKSIISRRNQIVHEADIDIQTNLRNSIDENDAKEVVSFIFTLSETIFDLVKA